MAARPRTLLRRVLTTALVATLASVGLGATAPAQATTDYSASLTASWYPNNGVVRAVLVTPDTIYLGGSFTAMRNANGGPTVQRSRLAAIDRTTHQLTSWNPGADGAVWALAQSEGVIYAGGDFANVAGQPATRLAAIDSYGAQVPGFSAAPNNQVRDLLVTADGLYVAGKFARVGTSARSAVARLNLTTGALQSWRPVLTGGKVFALTETPGGIVLGGSFDTASGVARQGLAQVSTATGADTGWSPEAFCDCEILDLDTHAGIVYASAAGGGGGRAVAWSLADGEIQWNRRGDGDCQAIDYYDGRVYVGGHFGVFLGQPQHQLVILDQNGTMLPFSLPMVGNDHPGTWSVHADADGLYFGGGFQQTSSSTRRFGILSAV